MMNVNILEQLFKVMRWRQAAQYIVDNTPPSGTVSPATTVVGPDGFGSAAVVGVDLTYAREDHDHGLPTISATDIDPAAATTVTGPDAFGASPVVGMSNFYARADHDHGLPAAPQPILNRTTAITVPDHCCVVSVDYFAASVTLQGDAAMAII